MIMFVFSRNGIEEIWVPDGEHIGYSRGSVVAFRVLQ